MALILEEVERHYCDGDLEMSITKNARNRWQVRWDYKYDDHYGFGVMEFRTYKQATKFGNMLENNSQAL